MTRHRLTLCVVLAAVFLTVVFGGAPLAAAKTDVVVARFGTSTPVGDYLNRAESLFCEKVKEKTGGKLIIEYYPASQLGSDREVIEAVDLGTVQFVGTGVGRLSLYHPVGIVFNIPYLFKDRAHADAVLDGRIGDEIRKIIYDNTNFILFPLWHRGARCISANRPIRSVNDLKGLKIRVPEWAAAVYVWKALGANPVALPLSELFSALQTGVVDAQENPVTLIYSAGFHKVQKYVMLTNHQMEDWMILTNKAWFESLPESHQRAIREAMAEAKAYAARECARETEDAIAKLKAEGTIVIDTKDIDITGFLKRAEVAKDFPQLKSSKVATEIYNKIVAGK